MSNWYSIRVTPRDDSDLGKLKAVVRKLEGAYIIVREHAQHEHYHALVMTDKKTPRSTLTNEFGANGQQLGNKIYSMKKTEFDAAARYVCKGDSEHPSPRGNPPDVVCSYGLCFSPAEIQKYHEKYWEVSTKIKQGDNTSFAVRVENYMKVNNMRFEISDTVQAVMDMTISEKKVMNEFYMVGVAKLIMAKNSASYKKAMHDHLVRKVNFDNIFS